MLDWEQLIEERDKWVAYNFPNHKYELPVESVVGCIEELGELAHAHLKQAQKIRGTDTEHEKNAMDAIGDITIYLLGVMSHEGVPLTFLPVHTRDSWQALLYLGYAVGELCYKSGPSAIPVASKVITACENYCKHREWDYDIIVLSTWRGVKERDWIAYPDTGFPPEATEDEMQDPPPLVDDLNV